MEDASAAGRRHKLTVEGRAAGTITGICDVISFDETGVVLDTELGRLTIRGRELHVSRLSLEKGEADIEGTIDSLAYSSSQKSPKEQGETLFSRLFR